MRVYPVRETGAHPEQLSVAVGVVYVTVWAHVPAATVVVMFAGQVIVGAVLSVGTAVNVQVPVLPEESVAVKVIVVLPDTMVPAAGDWVTTILPVGVQLSKGLPREV
jgi:predicted component of type VI protein secretion system